MTFEQLLSKNMFQNKNTKLDITNTAVLHVFLQDASFRSFTKTEFIGFTEFLCKDGFVSEIIYFMIFVTFLANTGGLLGLFMGFSVLSVIEILYFFTMRPYYMNKRDKELHNRAFKLVSKY